MILAVITVHANAAYYGPIDRCVRINHDPTSSNNEPGRFESVLPEYGTTNRWSGASDRNYTNMDMPNVNIANLRFQPVGTVVGSSIKHFLDFAESGNFSPDQVLYKCPAAAEGQISEVYATNGDYQFGGRDDMEFGASFGMEHVYATYVTGLGFRLTNLSTGESFSHIWKARTLTGLDRDQDGNILVKAKNFSNIKIELIRIPDVNPNTHITSGWPVNGPFTNTQPLGYFALRLPKSSNMNNLSGPIPGRNSRSHFPGWHGDWPAAIGLYRSVSIQRGQTCLVNFITPTVKFLPITVMELNQGHVRRGRFSVSYECEQGAKRGTDAGEVSMFFLTTPEAFSAAKKLSLVNAGVSTPYLLSENYNADSTSKGIAVTLYDQSGKRLSFADPNQYFNQASNLAQIVPEGKNTGGLSYTMSFDVELSKIGNGIKVTPGNYTSTARVVMRFN